MERLFYGIDAISRILDEMIAARACADCPKWCKSDYLTGGLLEAINRLVGLVAGGRKATYELEKDLKKSCPVAQESGVEK